MPPAPSPLPPVAPLGRRRRRGKVEVGRVREMRMVVNIAVGLIGRFGGERAGEGKRRR